MQLTGQPMVDVGFAIAAHLQGKKSVSDVTETDLQEAVKRLNSLTNPDSSNLGLLNRLNVLAAYWQNNPLMGKNKNVAEYRKVLIGVSESSPKTRGGYCHICGRNQIYIDANRSWFPLGASADSDPCSLPGLSGKFLCTSCFSAIVLLPLGCKFVGNNPYLFHLNDPDLLCEAEEIGFQAIQQQIAARARGNTAIKYETKLTGRLALLEIVAGSRLWDINQGGKLTRRATNGATILSFSNSGTSASWYQLHLPAQSLDFFAALDSANLRDTFLKWAAPCKGSIYEDKKSKQKRLNELFEMLCDDVEQRRSLGPLVRTILVRRDESKRVLSKEERKVLEIYEDVALGKQQRFEVLQRIAKRINQMDKRSRESFVKRLANLRKKESLLDMLREYAHYEKTSLRLSQEELQMLDAERSNEVISLLYLLCVAEE